MTIDSFNRRFRILLRRSLRLIFSFLNRGIKFFKKIYFSGGFKKKLILSFLLCFFLSFLYFSWLILTLPRLLSMKDYKPPLLTEVYDRNNEKVGEFFKQRRLLFKYEDMPKHLVFAFVAAEDGNFFTHKGLNYKAILRALIANIKAGRKVQGGSTITQQVARSLLLTSKKTYTRKFKEAVLSLRMENALSKQDILYIYFNQIYLGHGSYGVEMASQIYFRKSTKDLTIGEAAILAGLPKAPSRFSPIFNPERAKNRQIYVLNRMREDGYLTEGEFRKHLAEPIKVFVRENFNAQSPHYLETVRRLMLLHFDSEDLLRSGLKVYTSLDLQKQKAAQAALKKGLEDLDKRQGYRGVKTNLASKKEREEFKKSLEKRLKRELRTFLTIPGFSFDLLKKGKFSRDSFEILSKDIKESKKATFTLEGKKHLLKGKIFKALVLKVKRNRVDVLTPFGKKHLLLEDFKWAVPIGKKQEQSLLKDSRDIFKVNDVLFVKVKKTRAEDLQIELYQKPLVESALLSFDLETSEVVALVGGYDFSRSEFNRTYQSRRQPGSVFKPFVYGSALERGFNPASIISDAPVVFSNEEAEEKIKAISSGEDELVEEEEGVWKPSNISNRFLGDILLRTALIRSLNVPTVKIIEKIGLGWVRFYVRRLGLFSPLNSDFTMALGSSALTVYELLKSFSVFPRGGKTISPLMIHRVEDRFGDVLKTDITLDELFVEEIEKSKEYVRETTDKWFPKKEVEEDNHFWRQSMEEESSQILLPEQAYIVNSLLEAVVSDPEGTGRRARVLDRPLAGKTGTTNGYYDAWFMGYSPVISTGVWVGFDTEKTLGRGETGSRSALPIWIDYMREAHRDIPKTDFAVPEKIIFVNIDGDTGGLVSSQTKKVVRQAFIEGTEPQSVLQDREDSYDDEESSFDDSQDDESDFIKEDLSR